MQDYQSNYKGESSAFGIAAIGNVANDTINLIRMWTNKEYNDSLSSQNRNYYLQLKNKEKIVKLLVVGLIVFYAIKK